MAAHGEEERQEIRVSCPADEDINVMEGGSVRLFAGSDHRLVLKEGGLVDFYSVALTSRPRQSVEVLPVSSNPLVVVTPKSIRISPEDWKKVRTFMVLAVDCPGSDSAKDAQLHHLCHSEDPRYQSPGAIVNPSSIQCTVCENDAPFLFATGDGEYGQTGLGHLNLVRIPTRIDMTSAVNKPMPSRGGVADRSSSQVRPWHHQDNSADPHNSRDPKRPSSARPGRTTTSMMLQRVLVGKNVVAESASEAIARRRRESSHRHQQYSSKAKESNFITKSNASSLTADKAEEELMISLFPDHCTLDDHIMLQSEKDRELFRRHKRVKLRDIHAKKLKYRENQKSLSSNDNLVPSHMSILSCGADHSAMVTGKGKLYTWGNGISGALGLGEQANRRRPCVWNFTDALRNVHRRVKTVSCGEDHTVIVMQSGLVLSFGNGDNGRLGHGDSRPLSKPKVVESLRDMHVESVACGGKFTLLMVNAGGSTASLRGNVKVDRKSKMEDKVKGIGQGEGGGKGSSVSSEGGQHKNRRSAGVGGDGGIIVMSAGHGRTGALGHGDRPSRSARRSDCRTFQHIKALKEVAKPVSISAGAMHSAVLCADGRLLTFGFGENGQLGRRIEGSSSDLPGAIRLPKGVSQHVRLAKCGGSHTMLINDDNEVWAFGSNAHGQLGLGDRRHRKLPHLVQNLVGKEVIDLGAGQQHSAAVCEDGSFYVFGAGSQGQLGFENAGEDFLVPVKNELLSALRVVAVACGSSHTLVTTFDHSLQTSYGKASTGVNSTVESSSMGTTKPNDTRRQQHERRRRRRKRRGARRRRRRRSTRTNSEVGADREGHNRNLKKSDLQRAWLKDVHTRKAVSSDGDRGKREEDKDENRETRLPLTSEELDRLQREEQEREEYRGKVFPDSEEYSKLSLRDFVQAMFDGINPDNDGRIRIEMVAKCVAYNEDFVRMIRSRSEVEAIARDTADQSGIGGTSNGHSLRDSLHQFDLDGDGWLTVTELLTFAKLRADEILNDVQKGAPVNGHLEKKKRKEHRHDHYDSPRDTDEQSQEEDYEEDYEVEMELAESSLETTLDAPEFATARPSTRLVETSFPAHSVTTVYKKKILDEKTQDRVGPYSQTRIKKERKLQEQIRKRRFDKTFRKAYPEH